MKTDSEVKRDVEDEIKYDQYVDSTDIAFSVKNGEVSLTGYACNYSQKLQAEADAKRISGVMAGAQSLQGRHRSNHAGPDPAKTLRVRTLPTRDVPFFADRR